MRTRRPYLGYRGFATVLGVCVAHDAGYGLIRLCPVRSRRLGVSGFNAFRLDRHLAQDGVEARAASNDSAA